MCLIYFFTDKSNDKWLINDFIRFSFKKCFIFYYHENATKLYNSIEELKKKIKPQTPKIVDIDDIFNKNNNTLNINNLRKIFQNNEDFPFKLFLVKLDNVNKDKNLRTSLLDNIKLIIETFIEVYEKNNTIDKKLIFDITNCSSINANLIHFLIIKYILEYNIENLEIISWDIYSNQIFEIPVKFIDSTTQIILDLIASGISTIKELQEIYTQIKGLNKIVSQPFISKYISKLLKLGLISEEWIEGLKNFYLTESGKLYIHSNLIREKYSKLISKKIIDSDQISTNELVQKLIISYKNNEIETTNNLFKEILKRQDIKKEEILLIAKKLKDFEQEKIKALLKKGLNIYKNSPEIMTKLAEIYYNEKNIQEAFSLCKKAIELKADYPEAWELLGKLTFK
ncbi:MAG: tetratricopeptide repeat protein [Candidatus Helarchaeota archaeon]